MKNVEKLGYKEILKYIKQHTSRFNNFRSESDLRNMNSAEAIELVSWFNEYAFNCPRERLFCSDERNLFHESAARLMFIVNNNLMLLQGIHRVNNHIPYHFSMLLEPAAHQESWKVLL